ncbi:MAG: hypothetical protein ACYC35_19805 [Pirellulales bacterium]
MLARLLKTAPGVLLATAAAAWTIGWGGMPAYAQCGACGQGAHGGHDAGSAGHQHGDRAAQSVAADRVPPGPPHGGQLTVAEPLNFEVVYRPREIRVYIYGVMPYPASAREVRGEAIMQVRGDPRRFGYPLRYVAPADGSNEQDYLTVAVDVTRVRDGGMTVTLNLENLPLPQRPSLTFTQTFALTKPQVTTAPLGASDRAGIARQRVCPITGERLGGMGDPIKVLVDGWPLYLCCQGCIAKVKNDPAAYLPKAAPRVTTPALDESDRAGIAGQRVCPVTGAPLGSMGDPIKVLVDGRPLYLCCQGCLGKVQSDPEEYLRKAGQASQGR